MRLILQRVLKAMVKLGPDTLTSIERGLVVMVSFLKGDTKTDAEWMAQKALRVRLWNSLKGDKRWDTSLMQNKYELLIVPQEVFLVEGSPLDIPMEDEKEQMKLYEIFVDRAQKEYAKEKGKENVKAVPYGKQVTLDMIGDGPVTLIAHSLQEDPKESKKKK